MLVDSLEIIQYRQDKLNGLESTYKDEQTLVQANKSVGGANVGVNIENLQKVADFFRNRMIELQTRLIDIHIEQKKLKERITRVQQQLNELNAKRNLPTSTITITVSAKSHTGISLDLSYYV